MASKIKYNLDFDSLTSKELKLLEKASEAIKKFVSKSDKINQVNYKTRDAHVTAYSTLKGTFVANKNFEEHPIFPKQELDCLIRISNAHMKLVSQKRTIPAYGFSVKISDDNQTIANFPMVNFPLFPINNVSRFLKIFITINRFFAGNILQKFWNLIKIIKNFILVSPAFFHPSFIAEVSKFLKKRNNFILSFDYHSIGVYRLGNDLVKLKLVPKNVRTKVVEKHIDHSIQNYFKENEYELELMVQYCYDLKKQPVNQLNKMWKKSDFVLIGTIRITELIDKNNQWVENLSFNPFENIEELQPVGRIQKLRDETYKASFTTRKNNDL
ncbi:catalase [Epilithonimonas sp.]|uniref:catalase n=1 Tax=Epilithonimonas sp. TaxID=2894511 RepID=UPI00289E9AD8|nr:catalase [Epilithonimonas sp.]